MPYTERELLRLHVEAVWYIRVPELAGDEAELAVQRPEPPEDKPEQLPAWATYQARLAGGGSVRLWRAGVARGERAELAGLTERALDHPAEKIEHVIREVALRLVAEPTMPLTDAERIAQRLRNDADPRLLAFYEQAGYHLGGEQEPIFGVTEGGQVVTVAHSSRRTEQARELGINTKPGARRRGYALAATILWTRAILDEGLIPFYSALAENSASLALAHAAGYREFARAAYVRR